MIANPTPIQAATFNGMWITMLQIIFPTVDKPRGIIQGRLLPYDGTTLLALGGKEAMRSIPSQDAQTTAMLTALETEVKRLANTTAAVRSIQVFANDPSKPVFAQFTFVGVKQPHRIVDCFALAATDAMFAGVLNATMAEVARIAGLKIV
jgi:hypothetical protein